MDRSGDWITFKDMYSSKVFRLTDKGPVETTVIDFGKLAIPERVYNMELREAREVLNSKATAGIFKYFENEQFIYLFFFITAPEDVPSDHYHWLVNKKTGSSILHQLPDASDDHLYKGAKALTVDNKLIFIGDEQMLKDPFFKNAESIKNSLTEESNPVIISLQIKDF